MTCGPDPGALGELVDGEPEPGPGGGELRPDDGVVGGLDARSRRSAAARPRCRPRRSGATRSPQTCGVLDQVDAAGAAQLAALGRRRARPRSSRRTSERWAVGGLAQRARRGARDRGIGPVGSPSSSSASARRRPRVAASLAAGRRAVQMRVRESRAAGRASSARRVRSRSRLVGRRLVGLRLGATSTHDGAGWPRGGPGRRSGRRRRRSTRVDSAQRHGERRAVQPSG